MADIEINFTNIDDVVQDGKNKLAIHCPNTSCMSLILNPNVGFYTSDQKREVPKMTQRVDDDPGTNTDTITECFRVEDMYDFENVGYSFNHNDVKYLTCADCELGPIGWFKDRKSYVALSRVRFEEPGEKQSEKELEQPSEKESEEEIEKQSEEEIEKQNEEQT